MARIETATTDPELALDGAKIIMVALPATGHRWTARTLAPYLSGDQIVVLNPGRTGGALEFMNILSEMGAEPAVVAEASTLLVASRLLGPAEVHIYGFKRRVPLAAVPASEISRVTALLRKVFPQFRQAGCIMETSLNNIGALFHPIPALFNAARIEDPTETFEYYRQGVTPAVCRVMTAVDAERMEIASELGVSIPSTVTWMERTYGATAHDLATALASNPSYAGIQAPMTLEHRYFLEDIPTGLVPMAYLGDLLGVPTPTIKLVVDMASVLLGIDFWSRGRTLRRMGLEGLTAEQLRGLVATGEREGMVV